MQTQESSQDTKNQFSKSKENKGLWAMWSKLNKTKRNSNKEEANRLEHNQNTFNTHWANVKSKI